MAFGVDSLTLSAAASVPVLGMMLAFFVSLDPKMEEVVPLELKPNNGVTVPEEDTDGKVGAVL